MNADRERSPRIEPAAGWLLIDGYNLLHASGVFGSRGRTVLEASREALLDWLGAVLTEPQRERTVVVFDARLAPPGLPRYARKHGLEIEFAPRGGEADEVLERRILEHPVPRSLTVVSSDHRIHRAARRRRARAVDSDVWVAEIRRERTAGGMPLENDWKAPPDPAAVQRWLDEFRER